MNNSFKKTISGLAAAAIALSMVQEAPSAGFGGLLITAGAEEIAETECVYSFEGEIEPGVGSFYDVGPEMSYFGFANSTVFNGCYKNQLDEQSKKVYDKLLEYYGTETSAETLALGITGTVSGVSIVDGAFTAESSAKLSEWARGIIRPAFLALTHDHPELSWLMNLGYSMPMSEIALEGDVATIGNLGFRLASAPTDTGNINDINAAVANAKATINEKVNNSTIRYYIVKAIHDYLCETIEYNHDAAEGGVYTATQERCYQTAYSAFYPCNGDEEILTVCAGYAKGFKVLCDSYNIPCVLVLGDAGSDGEMGAHAWNYVQMEDGKWYAIDATWDDQGVKNGVNDTRTDYLLAGSNSQGFNSTEFDESHIASGNWTDDANSTIIFTYPELATEAYVYSAKADISTATIIHTDSPVYDGSFRDHSISEVKYNGVTLTANVDYRISGITAAIGAGTYSATITGIGNYGGTKTVEWTVAKATPAITVTTDPVSDIAGKTITVITDVKNPHNETLTNLPKAVLTYKIGDGEETAIENGTFVIPENTAIGTEITIIARTAEATDYNAAEGTAKVTVIECPHDDVPKEWTTDGTNHWHICGCCGDEVDKATHSGGTATCAAKAKCSVCEAEYGAIDSTNHANKATKLSSNETGHWYACGCGEKLEYAEHKGGTATCAAKAKCSVCEAEYGEIDSTNHASKATKLSSDETGHWYACGCGEKLEYAEHKGGKATCTAKAECEDCGTEYGEIDSTNHANKATKLSSNETGHWYACGCGEKLEYAEHKGGEATCAAKAKCSVCEAEYGEFDSTNHANEATKLSSNETGHWYACDCGKLDFAKHKGGEATCAAKAKCSVCEAEYGAIDSTNHANKATKLSSDETGHWYACDCGKLDFAKHKGGEATCAAKAKCEICGTEYGKIDIINHVNKSTEVSSDETGHWYACDCGKLGFEKHISNGKATATTAEICKICGFEIAPPTGTTESEKEHISNFVERLYTKMLGRESDADGKAHNVALITDKNYTAADIAGGFVLGDEIRIKKLSNVDFVTRMYRTFMDREPDEGGLKDWVNALDGGCSYGFVFNSFVASQEFANICAEYGMETGSYTLTEPRDMNRNLTAFVSRMYTKALNRSYDVNGLNDWTNRYLTSAASISDISYGFIFSQEFINKNLNDSDYVDTLYRTFFNREPDDGGKADWLDRIAKGATREDVLFGFVGSQECINLVASFGIN